MNAWDITLEPRGDRPSLAPAAVPAVGETRFQELRRALWQAEQEQLAVQCAIRDRERDGVPVDAHAREIEADVAARIAAIAVQLRELADDEAQQVRDDEDIQRRDRDIQQRRASFTVVHRGSHHG